MRNHPLCWYGAHRVDSFGLTVATFPIQGLCNQASEKQQHDHQALFCEGWSACSCLQFPQEAPLGPSYHCENSKTCHMVQTDAGLVLPVIPMFSQTPSVQMLTTQFKQKARSWFKHVDKTLYQYHFPSRVRHPSDRFNCHPWLLGGS